MKVKEFQAENFCYPDRKFKLMFYQISHSEMILRSYKDGYLHNISYEKNIDIYFGDVDYIELPQIIYGIKFRKATADDIRYLSAKTHCRISEDNVVVIISEDKEYYIVASIIKISENELGHVVVPICCHIAGNEHM